MTRKTPLSPTRKCGNNRSRNMKITSSTRTKRISGPGTRMNRSISDGTGTRASSSAPSSSFTSLIVRLKPRLGRKGNGWAGSIAIGDRIG